MSRTRKYNRRRRVKTRARNRKRYRKHRGGSVNYPPNSITNYINHVVYINLDSRNDRRLQMDEQLKVFPADSPDTIFLA